MRETITDTQGRIWTPEDVARELASAFSPREFVEFMNEAFDIHPATAPEDHERMVALIDLRERSLPYAIREQIHPEGSGPLDAP